MKPVALKSPFALLQLLHRLNKSDPHAVVGRYLYKNYHIQISEYGLSGGQRVARLYHKRRAAGLCILCSAPVSELNPRTGKRYRFCATHRASIDRKGAGPA